VRRENGIGHANFVVRSEGKRLLLDRYFHRKSANDCAERE
jgi:hypothetical protein